MTAFFHIFFNLFAFLINVYRLACWKNYSADDVLNFFFFLLLIFPGKLDLTNPILGK